MATIDVTEATFESTIMDGGIVLVDCWASWCGPCRQFGPIFEKVSDNHPDVTFAKLDTEANQGLSAALQIQSIPTVMAFRDGILLFREAGAFPAAALEQLVQDIKALDMDKVRADIAAQQQENQD